MCSLWVDICKGKPKESWEKEWTDIDPQLILEVISYYTSTLIFQTILSSLWKSEFSRRYIIQPNNPNLSTPFRRKREEHWIQQLGTAAPYGCNDHIDSIGNLISPGCQSVNVLNLFDQTSRRHRRHGNIIRLRYTMSPSTVFCRSSIYS